MKYQSLSPLGLGYAAAILAALGMVFMGVLGLLGIYEGAVEMMQQWHLYFDLSFVGIVAGALEAAVISFVFGYLFGWLYNKFL